MNSNLHCTDCIAYAKTLPDKHFFLTIADPPYFNGPEQRKNEVRIHPMRRSKIFTGWWAYEPQPSQNKRKCTTAQAVEQSRARTLATNGTKESLSCRRNACERRNRP